MTTVRREGKADGVALCPQQAVEVSVHLGGPLEGLGVLRGVVVTRSGPELEHSLSVGTNHGLEGGTELKKSM